MGQIVGGAAKPKRCNLNQLSLLGTPAAGEHILVSSDNSMSAAGQGNFDCYIVGDGKTVATALELKNVETLIGVFDISSYHATGGVLAKYADLTAALNDGNNIPQSFRKGGMSVKFVQSSDNNSSEYVQYRLMSDTFSTTESDWQGVDKEPKTGSRNLVESVGVKGYIDPLKWDVYGKREDTYHFSGYNKNFYGYNFENGKSYSFKLESSYTDGFYFSVRDSEGTAIVSERKITTTPVTIQFAPQQDYNNVCVRLSCSTAIDVTVELVVNDGIEYDINQINEKLNNSDTVPVEGSTNLVLSGGVYTAIDNAIFGKSNYDIIDGTVTVESITSDKYVNYSSGNVITGSAYHHFKLYKYIITDLLNIKQVKAKLGVADTVPAMIAFYSSSSVFDSTTYIQSSSVQAVSGTNWYIATVPLNAKAILITNREATLDTPVINLYYDGLDNRYDKDILLSRNAESQSSGIYKDFDCSSLNLGTQIEIDVTALGGDSDAYILLKSGTRIDSYSRVLKTGKYYFEKYASLTAIRFEKVGISENLFNFVVSSVHTYSIANRIIPNFSLSSKNTIDIGSPKSGYYNYSTGTWNNTKQWVSYDEQKSNGYTIHIAGDFETYYVIIRILDYAYPRFYHEINITEEGDFDIPQTCFGWNLMFRRIDYEFIEPYEVEGDVTITFVSGYIFEKSLSESDKKELADKQSSDKEEIDKELSDTKRIAKEGYALNVFANYPHYYHFSPNSFIKTGDNKNAIASESLDDIELAARLGFKVIEANIYQTSDGNFICIHGDSGKFGIEVKSVDENIITTEALRNTAINTKSLSWIKENVVYDSYFAKYQTSIPSLEEFCGECRKYGLGIFAGTSIKEAIEICIKILGQNVFIYSPPSDVRTYFNGYLFNWFDNVSTTPEYMLNKARTFGAPYMTGLGPHILADMITNDTLNGFIDSMHAEGFLVGWTGVYDTDATGRLVQKLGMDFNCSGHDVNPFEPNYEVFDTDSDNNPTTTGSISDGIISLSNGDTITCGSSIKIVGKGWLTIKFNGALTINFGSCGNTDRTISSDGSEDIVITDYFFMRESTLTVTAGAETTVTKFLYKTSKC